jgi:hypothetical protein
MATIVKTPAGTWKAVVRKTGWPTNAKTFRTKRDAADWARRTEDEMVRGVYIPTGDFRDAAQYGNPDGKQAMEVGIGMPSLLLDPTGFLQPARVIRSHTRSRRARDVPRPKCSSVRRLQISEPAFRPRFRSGKPW